MASIRRMRSSESTSSPLRATAPPARPVRPPDGTTATPASLQARRMVATSSVVRGHATAQGAGVYTLVQSFP